MAGLWIDCRVESVCFSMFLERKRRRNNWSLFVVDVLEFF